MLTTFFLFCQDAVQACLMDGKCILLALDSDKRQEQTRARLCGRGASSVISAKKRHVFWCGCGASAVLLSLESFIPNPVQYNLVEWCAPCRNSFGLHIKTGYEPCGEVLRFFANV
jgi:hypothetical protein